jgi:hypothetical protein
MAGLPESSGLIGSADIVPGLSRSFAETSAAPPGRLGLGGGILRTISSGTFVSGSTRIRIVTARPSRLSAVGVCASTVEAHDTNISE